MSLETALNTAKMSLAANAKQIAVSARNVAGADDPNYSRKSAPTITYGNGVVATGPVRASDSLLYERYLGATSATKRDEALLDGYTRLAQTVGDTEDGASLVGRTGALVDALREYANAPGDDNLARAAVTSAKDLVRAVNDAAQTVETLRVETDAEIRSSADTVSKLLTEFEELNTRITAGTSSGLDVTDDLDRRDVILGRLSEEIGITVVSRANNDLVLYSDSGVTLFETIARSVTATNVNPTTGAADNPPKSYIVIDGVWVTGEGAQMPLKSGRIAGLAELQDKQLPAYAAQLDSVAFGLVSAFQETDTSGLNALAGLFTNAGAPALPGSSTPMPPDSAGWLASALSVNTRVDPDKGGDPTLLRDGVNSVDAAGNPDPDYAHNTEGAASYSAHLFGLLDAAGARQDALGGKTLLDYGASTVAWVAGNRQSSDSASKASGAALQLLSTTLSNARGVDLNDEAALQLQLERSFQATAQVMAIVNSLYEALLSIVR